MYLAVVAALGAPGAACHGAERGPRQGWGVLEGVVERVRRDLTERFAAAANFERAVGGLHLDGNAVLRGCREE